LVHEFVATLETSHRDGQQVVCVDLQRKVC
jgi:hypothetical protein